MLRNLVERVFRPGDELDFMYVDDSSVGFVSQFSTDRALIEVSKELLKECDEFIEKLQLAQQELPTMFFKKLRQQRRDNKLFSQFENIVPRIKILEKQLRALLGLIVDKKNLARQLTKYLHVRVEACKAYNTLKLEKAKNPAVEAKSLLLTIVEEVTSYKNMLSFNEEVILSKYSQDRGFSTNGPSNIPWSSRINVQTTLGGSGLRGLGASRPGPNIDCDDDKIIIQDRIDKLNDLKLKCTNVLSSALQQREKNQSLKENCEQCLAKVATISRKEASVDEIGSDFDFFDHKICSNCDYACKLCFTLVTRYVELSEVGANANTSLQNLVEIREVILDLAVKIEFTTSNNASASNSKESDFDFQSAGLVTSKFSGGASVTVTRSSISGNGKLESPSEVGGNINSFSSVCSNSSFISSSTQNSFSSPSNGGLTSPIPENLTLKISSELDSPSSCANSSNDDTVTLNRTIYNISTLLDSDKIDKGRVSIAIRKSFSESGPNNTCPSNDNITSGGVKNEDAWP